MASQGGKTSLPPEFRQLGQEATGLIRQTRQPRKEILGQLTEALRTGGVGAKIPLIQRSVEASNQAQSQALGQTAEQLAAKNIGGTAGARIMAGQRQAGAQATSQIPVGVAERLIQAFTPFLSGTQQLGFGALGQTGQASFASDAFNAQQFARAMGDIKSSLQSAGSGAAACLHPDCMVETPNGPIAVVDLEPGDEVWTVDTHGKRVPALVIAQQSRKVDDDHAMFKLQDAAGGFFYVSPKHPLPNGRPIDEVWKADIVRGATNVTYDIFVSGDTGAYVVQGVVLGSTMDPRHTRKAA